MHVFRLLNLVKHLTTIQKTYYVNFLANDYIVVCIASFPPPSSSFLGTMGRMRKSQKRSQKTNWSIHCFPSRRQKAWVTIKTRNLDSKVSPQLDSTTNEDKNNNNNNNNNNN